MSDDFGKIREQARKDGEQSRLMSDPGVTPEVGGIYTVSPDFVCGDRSYTTNFIEVLAVTGTAALVKIHDHWNDKPKLMPISERFWYDAKQAFETYKAVTND